MTTNVSIIDFGAGNLLNVQRAFEHQGAKVEIVTSIEQIERAQRIVFPGVGAFPEAMRQLQQLEIVEAIQQKAAQVPFLGICLGMQMMLDSSLEFGETQGLGLIEGSVEPLPEKALDDSSTSLHLPHIGWQEIVVNKVNQSHQRHSLIEKVHKVNAFYFVHSFYAQLDNVEDLAAYFDFGGHQITAVIQRDNLMGCQFHPEKSGRLGLDLIDTFLKI